MRKGYALVELVVALGVFSVIVFAIMQLFLVTQESSSIGNQKLKASSLLLEYTEELKNLQRHSWDSLTNGRYIIEVNSNNLALESTTSAENINDFERYLIISDVYRDTSGNIAPTGRLDSSTKKASIFVSWQGLHPSSFSQEIYLTRFWENLFWTQTLTADFNAGIMDMTKLVSPPSGNGEIQLKGGCTAGSPESLIYDDALRNGWRSNCSGLTFWRWLVCSLLTFFSNGTITNNSTTYTYNGSTNSIKIQLNPPSSGTSTSWVSINNFDGKCTIGFRNLHFYVYNPAATEKRFWVTAVYNEWNRKEVVVPRGVWTEISLDYSDVQGSYEQNLQTLYFSQSLRSSDPALIFYIDQMQLTGGVGGYFTEGTFVSSVFDSGRVSAFNRISFNGTNPANTSIGFQTAVSNYADGPWVYYGPGGTSINTDLYTNSSTQGIWLGANMGRYFRYKGYLKSVDGVSTPVLNDITINYSP